MSKNNKKNRKKKSTKGLDKSKKEEDSIRIVAKYIDKTQLLMSNVSRGSEEDIFISLIKNKILINEIVDIVKDTDYYFKEQISILTMIDLLLKKEENNKETILFVFKYIVSLIISAKDTFEQAECIVLNMPVLGYFINEYEKEIDDKKESINEKNIE